MTAIVSDWIDSSVGTASIVTLIGTISALGGTSQIVYPISCGSFIRFFKMVY